MNIDLNTPSDFYRNILSEIDRVLEGMNTSSTDKKIVAAQDSARKNLSGFKDDINESLNQLEQHADWKTFTIAFYGETNAGKSTIIETIRILLEEDSKVDLRNRFKTICQEHGASFEQIEQMRDAIQRYVSSIEELKEKAARNALDHSSRHKEFELAVSDLQSQILDIKNSMSLWQKFLHLFAKLPLEKTLIALQSDIKKSDESYQESVRSLDDAMSEIQQKKTNAETNLKKLQVVLDNLAEVADGAIIGDGRSDFTRATARYDFESGGQQFALLDVPGIEGQEAEVLTQINSAVQKAHAVFYVTGKAAAPQTGGGKSIGTLEKIKAHLGDQTEVWTIFNKRINSPIQLEREQLLQDDEIASLGVLDEKMQEQLGENYRGTIPISAQPAFYAVADCLVPHSQSIKNRNKFLKTFSTSELLDRSNVSALHTLLTSNLVSDRERKMKRANLNKVIQVVNRLHSAISAIHQEMVAPLRDQLKADARSSQSQLDDSVKSLKSRIESKGESAINVFNNEVRRKIYNEIEKDVSNDDFKRAFERAIAQSQKDLETNFPKIIDDELVTFQSEIEDIVNRFQKYVDDLLTNFSSVKSMTLGKSIALKIDIGHGIKVGALVSTMIGAALLAWNPGGWVLATIGVITVLVGLAKSVWGFFSSDYKKSQQRNSVDENLSKITSQIRSSMSQNLSSAFPVLEEKVEEIKVALNEPFETISEMSKVIVTATIKISTLSKNLESASTQS